ncbi:hypothetical protein [Butyrivibrio sp. INlla16]|uniref:hypothetical protein n=1 Tax=Butyrivibrio sp. INlla16 TaxID=1520807 RepID=UPI0008907223|nr:hypothetical protein [Butyrivibrio sp. INlla16]SDB68446.1 hypothetical protein SAMN02910263_04187 [Butyrivibrio sp. INlla16]
MERNKGIYNAVVVFALVIILINSIFYCMKKEGYFLDEKATFYYSSVSYTSFYDFVQSLARNDFAFEKTLFGTLNSAPMVIGERYTADEVKALFDAQSGDKFTFADTYLVSIIDAHPPLYYILFNTLNSSVPGISAKNIGFLINILSLLLTCIFLFKIIVLLTEDRLCGVFGILFYGLSYDFANCVMYIRMYALLTFLIVLLLYLYLLLANNDFNLNNKILLKICLVEVIAMLTQYYAALFIFPLFFMTIIFMLANKKTVKRYFACHIIIAIIYLCIWPFSIIQLTHNGRSQDIMNNAASFKLLLRIKEFGGLLKYSIFSGSKVFLIITVFFAALLGIICLKKIIQNGITKLKESHKLWLYLYLIIPVSIFYMVSVYISPWVMDRYVMPAIPIFSIIVIWVLWKSVKLVLKKDWICALLLMVVILVSYVNTLKIEPRYAYPITEKKHEFISNNVDKEALIIEPENDAEYIEVVDDINHPYWTMIKDKGLSDYLKETFIADNDYAIYISKYCDLEHITGEFAHQNYSIINSGYSTDFFDVYIYQKSPQ